MTTLSVKNSKIQIPVKPICEIFHIMIFPSITNRKIQILYKPIAEICYIFHFMIFPSITNSEIQIPHKPIS